MTYTFVKAVIKVSSEVQKLIEEGKLGYGSGGLRWLEGAKKGEIFRQYQFAGIVNASEQNDLAKHVLKAVNKLNAQMGNTNNAVKSIKSMQWFQLGLEAANLAVNIAGFATVMAKLNEVSEQITTLSNELHEKWQKDLYKEINNLIDNLKSVTSILTDRRLKDDYIFDIEKHLNQSKNLIIDLAKEFSSSAEAEGENTFLLLYLLVAEYTAVIKEYGAQYYYLNNNFPAQYDTWVRVFDQFEDNTFKHALKRTIWLTHPTESTRKLKDGFNYTLNTFNEQKNVLVEYKNIIPKIAQEDYFNMDSYMEKLYKDGDFITVDNFEDKQAQAMLKDNGYRLA